MKKQLVIVVSLMLILGVGLNMAYGQEPRMGGSLTYGIASSDVTVGVDPHVIQGDRTGWVLGQVCEGLLNYDQGLNPVPWLAKSWEISEDGLEYTFYLEHGVKFHNGREMVADDVKFSLERILDPNTGSRRRANLEIIDHVDVVDPYTVKIVLKNSFSPFITYLVGVYAAIIPSESVDADGKVTQPMGTGPFTFVEWVKNDHLKVKRFPEYWKEGLPYLDEIVFKPLPDEAVRLTALRTDQVHITHALAEKLLPKLSKSTNELFILDVQPGVSWRMVIMNTRKPPFDNVKLRQAVLYAIDREELMLAITWGFGEVADQIWTPDSFWHMPDPVGTRDLEKAKTLLKEAGYEHGFNFRLECRSSYLPVAEVVQEQLKQAGIRAEIGVLDWASLKPRMQTFDFDMAVSGAGWYSDPDARYGRFYSENGPANYFAGGYMNSRVEELLAQGRIEPDPAKRKEIYTEIWRTTRDEAPLIMLFKRPMTHAWNKKVQNFRVSRQGDLAFKDGGLMHVWLTE
jgi:peptide/nickel transport system substrate-binding protein